MIMAAVSLAASLLMLRNFPELRRME